MPSRITEGSQIRQGFVAFFRVRKRLLTKTQAATPLGVYDNDTLNSVFYQMPSYNRKNLYSQELIVLIFCNTIRLFGTNPSTTA